MANTHCTIMSEKLCLKWNDYQNSINSVFGSLREENDFADVTLACEDGQQIEAHKVTLAAFSPFFQNLLKRNKHPHPLIYMKGMKYEILLSLVDFLYLGEANVSQESLDSFLEIAEELKIKGLIGQKEDTDKTENQKMCSISEQVTSSQTFHERNQNNPINGNVAQILTTELEDPSQVMSIDNERRISPPNFVSGDFKALDEKVKSMMEKSQNRIKGGLQFANICKVCRKEGAGIAIRDHIEANHLEGVSLPCNVCGKKFRSRAMLRKHNCVIIEGGDNQPQMTSVFTKPTMEMVFFGSDAISLFLGQTFPTLLMRLF